MKAEELTFDKRFHKLLERILCEDRFLLTTHLQPDPDGWGAELGLEYFLRSHNKNVIIFNEDAYDGLILPDTDGGKKPTILTSKQNFDTSIFENRTIVSLDNSSIERMGSISRYVKKDVSNLIVIDHHDGIASDDKTFFMFPRASATTEIVYILLVLANINPPFHILQSLYAGLVFDTGHFRYNKTSPLTHNIAARLLTAEVNPAQMSELISSTYKVSRIYARRCLLNNMQMTENKHIVWSALDMEAIGKEEGFTVDDLSGLLNDFFEVRDIYICLLFTQCGDKFTRLSIRSRLGFNALPIVEKYGGGGHKQACGVTLNMDLEEAVAAVIPFTEQHFFPVTK